MKIIVTLLFLIIMSTSLQAQQLFQSYSIASGSIIDDSTGKQIAFVHLYNESQRRGYIANEEGKFKVPASEGDTIVLSALGYLSRVVIVTDSYFHSGIVLELSPQIYEIDEVTVRAFRDYEDFKKQFLALQLPETETSLLRENLTILSRREAVKAANNKKNEEILGRSSTEFATVTIPILSREDKQRLNYAEVLKKEARQRVIEKKYNREIIYRVTQLSEDEITEFMGFCNFSEEFLYLSSYLPDFTCTYRTMVDLHNRCDISCSACKKALHSQIKFTAIHLSFYGLHTQLIFG